MSPNRPKCSGNACRDISLIVKIRKYLNGARPLREISGKWTEVTKGLSCFQITKLIS